MSSATETLDLVKTALGQPRPGDPRLAKADTVSQATGLVWYDLRAPSLSLFPVLTPIRNRTARVGGEGGTAIHWKAITAINPDNFGAYASEGNRGARMGVTEVDYLASYMGLGLEASVTFEADYAAKNFEDVRATAARDLLWATMLQEEKVLLGGNNSMALGTPGTITTVGTGLTTGGSILDGASVGVAVVALSYEGFKLASLTGGVKDQVVKANADATSDTYNGGHSAPSAIAVQTAASSANTNRVTASVPVVRGAVAYAWYVGSSGSSGGTQRLYAITTINSVNITSIPSTTQLLTALTASDYSENAMAFDGLLTYAMKSGLGGYFASLATGTPGTGTGLSSTSNTGQIDEIDTAFRYFYDTYRLGPSRIWVSSQEANRITQKIIANAGAPLVRLTAPTQEGLNGVAAGARVSTLLNKYTNEDVPLLVHPEMAPGTLLFDTDTVPYPMAGVANVKEVVCRRDYYQIEWPLRARRYEHGVYADEVLRVKVPFVFGAITNIADA